MTIINKEERNVIAQRFPDVSIVRTMKGDSKRGHYYLEERRDVMNFLRAYRRRHVIEEYPVQSEKRPQRKKQNNKKNRRGDGQSLRTKK